LKSFRFHDSRHDAITNLAESDASDQTIMRSAGHLSRAMLEHYSHIRVAAKRRALDAISTPTTAPTGQVTFSVSVVPLKVEQAQLDTRIDVGRLIVEAGKTL
jgi:hypothetical protein